LSNVQCLWPVEIESLAVNDETASVTLRDGRRFEARLLVGADGAASKVRGAAGIGAREIDVDQKGIVATVRTERPHASTAYQRFLPTGPLALLPLSAPDASSIVWSAATASADELLALDDAAFTARLQDAFGDRLGRIVSVSRRQAFTLALAHARTYTAPRVALIGDAAHTVHPLAGQGVNLGWMDAAMLAETLCAAAARGRDIGTHACLRRYERARKGENLAMIALTGGFNYVFANSRPWARRLRRRAIALADACGPLKRVMMRRACGLEGDLPALARSWGGLGGLAAVVNGVPEPESPSFSAPSPRALSREGKGGVGSLTRFRDR